MRVELILLLFQKRIIQYKKVESSELINQSLYYLSWMRDHKGDFQIAVNKSLGAETEIDWSDIRVICIAPGYRKYDIHAVKMMGANIELWQYKLYENGIIYFEDIYRRKVDIVSEEEISSNKNPVMVAAGKKAAETRATGVYSVEEHFENINDELKKIISEVRDYILSLNESILEVPKKFYIAYKLNKNFTCMEVKSNKIILFLKLDPETIKPLPKGSRDVTNIGHYGTGNLEFTINNKEDLPKAFELIKLSFEEIGG
jgi:predicted transport protein